jgi:hypothetical protein
MNAAEQAHQSVIDVLVAQTAGHCATFGELLGRLPGVYPADAASALARLAAGRLVDPAAAARLTPAVLSPAANGEGDEDGILPPPHPLDFDWRFDLPTARRLRFRCVQLSRPGDTIALLGTPTLIRAAGPGAQRRRWVLLEASPATTAALKPIAPDDVLRCDLTRDELPRLDARVLVADPPWYPAYARAFLWAAAQLSSPGPSSCSPSRRPPPGPAYLPNGPRCWPSPTRPAWSPCVSTPASLPTPARLSNAGH